VLLEDGITICSNCCRLLLVALVVDCATADCAADCPGVGGLAGEGVAGECPGTLFGVRGGAGEDTGLEGLGDWLLGGTGELMGIGLAWLCGDIWGEACGKGDLYIGLLPPDGICFFPGWGPGVGIDGICPGCPVGTGADPVRPAIPRLGPPIPG
jgi:hypothetical protein